MGYPLFFGCLFIAYGPTVAIFLFSIAKSSQLVILCIGSSFFWLISLLVASIWWYIIPPLQNQYWWAVFWSVLFQELMRYTFLRLYQRAEYDLVASARTAQITAHPDILKAALAMGLGVGATQALVNYVTVLWEALGDGSYYAPSCPSVNLFILSAIYALYFTLLHIFWSVQAILAHRLQYNKRLVGIGLLHLVASLLTLLNLPGGHCAATLVLLTLFTIGMGVLTYFSVIRSATLQIRIPLPKRHIRPRKKKKKEPAAQPAPTMAESKEVKANDTDPRAALPLPHHLTLSSSDQEAAEGGEIQSRESAELPNAVAEREREE